MRHNQRDVPSGRINVSVQSVRRKKIAIACQGGGTHVAFTWGALTSILRAKQRWDADGGTSFDLVSLSGTSAGALCALATWYGLAPNGSDPDCGTVDKAVERLDHLWTVFAATNPAETLHNLAGQVLLRWKAAGVALPESSPYAAAGRLGLLGLGSVGARPEYLGFQGLLASLCPDFDSVDWKLLAQNNVRVIAGAIEVLSGNFETFDSDKTLEELGLKPPPERDQYGATRWRMRRALSLDGVAASGTLPELLPAQPIENLEFPTADEGTAVRRTGYYWDGLYSQNPPVRDLLDTETCDDKPDEIWVVRINPQEYSPTSLRVGLEEIRDRENDLAGNLSLNQELDHILTVNRWIDKYGNDAPPLTDRKTVVVRTIKMSRDSAWTLDHASKLDRSPRHLAALRAEGTELTERWLADWRAAGDGFPRYPADARYT